MTYSIKVVDKDGRYLPFEEWTCENCGAVLKIRHENRIGKITRIPRCSNCGE